MSDLSRFLDAQAGVYEQALAELRAGRKTSHWIWFVFPQIAGLGASAMSQRYAIASLTEAQDYLGHPVLGPRLTDCTAVLRDLDAGGAQDILGAIDAVKVRSSMTLFHRADPGRAEFTAVLEKYYDGVEDPATLERL